MSSATHHAKSKEKNVDITWLYLPKAKQNVVIILLYVDMSSSHACYYLTCQCINCRPTLAKLINSNTKTTACQRWRVVLQVSYDTSRRARRGLLLRIAAWWLPSICLHIPSLPRVSGRDSPLALLFWVSGYGSLSGGKKNYTRRQKLLFFHLMRVENLK